MSISQSDKTRSGWQSYDVKRRRSHTTAWVPENYGFISLDGSFANGYLCYNCGKWDGTQLAKGELARMRRELIKC